jgi:serine/threonine protein kinase
MIGLQMFDRVKALHDNSYIHRDLKPDNFLIGMNEKKHVIYLIDLGLAKRFKSIARVHINIISGKKLVGTARYASINSHLGNELSRRDDLESLLYILIYFVKGILPWQGIVCTDRDEKYRLIGNSKIKTSIEDLCLGLPDGFKLYLQYVRALAFKEKPNYHHLRSLIVNMFTEHRLIYDNVYDW